MSKRLLEIYISTKYKNKAVEMLKEYSVDILSQPDIREDLCQIKGIMPACGSEEILDKFEKFFGHMSDFRMILIPIKAFLPRERDEENEVEDKKIFEKSIKISERISREELYSEINENSKLTRFYISMIVLSSFVAGIGLLNNNSAVIIGAMVIAPLLGPNLAFSLGAVLGDIELMKRSFKTGIIGIIIAVLISFLWGKVIDVNCNVPELLTRTNVGLSDIVLASASGIAGVLSITVGSSSVLVGVMVAVALLPPLVALGLLLSSASYNLAFGAFLVFFTNIICINLSGIITFFIQDVRPKTWWEENRAKKAIKKSLFILFLMLLLLIIVIFINLKV